MTAFRRRLALLVIVGLGSGCLVGPDYEVPVTDLPDVWYNQATRGVAEGEAPLQTWWEVFDDALLEELLQRAERANRRSTPRWI